MAHETFHLSNDAAQVYERQKIPAMFGPLADATLERVPVFDTDSVIDIACGTGIVARKVRNKIGPAALIVGTDLNRSMIDAASQLTDPQSRSCEWRVADVTDLPYEDGTFSMAFCQQGIQFFPDKEAALLEIKRVLRTDGRLSLTVWSGISEFFQFLSQSMSRHADDDVAKRTLWPFSFDGDTLPPLLSRLGYKNVTLQKLAVNRVMEASETSIRNEIIGDPAGATILQKGDAVMQAIVSDVFEGSARFRQGPNFVIPQPADLILATVG